MKIADGIRYVRQNMGGHVHAFLLDDGDGITLIDAMYDTEPHRILGEIAAMGRQPSDLKNIIATHAHRSHIGGMAELKKPGQRPGLCSRMVNWHHRRQAQSHQSIDLAQTAAGRVLHAIWPGRGVRRPQAVPG